jgi:FdhD protein
MNGRGDPRFAIGSVLRARFDGRDWRFADDDVAREEPLAIELHGEPLAVLMRTPGHDEELALGLLVTEGIVGSAADVASLHRESVARGGGAEENVMRAILRPGLAPDVAALRRNLYASSSCGVCGKTTLEGTLQAAPPLEDEARFPAGFFAPLAERMGKAQPAFARSGGLHAAALFDSHGELLVAREDVGRHNAVDKVIGWASREARLPLAGHVLLVSGRVSFEIVQKALAARVPLVAAVSAPSSLAVELATRARMALVAFLRGGSFNVYGERRRVEGAE